MKRYGDVSKDIWNEAKELILERKECHEEVIPIYFSDVGGGIDNGWDSDSVG